MIEILFENEINISVFHSLTIIIRLMKRIVRVFLLFLLQEFQRKSVSYYRIQPFNANVPKVIIFGILKKKGSLKTLYLMNFEN
jgi:hypothetical protein